MGGPLGQILLTCFMAFIAFEKYSNYFKTQALFTINPLVSAFLEKLGALV